MKLAFRNSLLFVLFIFSFFKLSGQGSLPAWDWELPTSSSPAFGASMDKGCLVAGGDFWGIYVDYISDAYRLGSLGNASQNLVSGIIFHDRNENCVRDSGEYGIPNFLIKAHPDQEFALSDSTGKYILTLDSGMKALTAYNPYIDGGMGICHPGDSLLFLLPNPVDTVNNLDIPIVLNDTCPRMLVELSSIQFRDCDSSQLYLSYSNISLDTVTNPYIELELDPILSLTSASIPYTSLGGNLYRFDLPPAVPFQSTNFVVNVFAACNSTLGQAICNVAHIYPDSGCPEISPLWSGASLAVTGTCTTPGTVKFEIKNVGTGSMTAPTSFIIVEDDVLRYNGTVLLNPGEDSTYFFLTNGLTWACFADQVDNHPFNSIPRAFVEGCGGFSTGHVHNHQQDDLEPFLSIDCNILQQSWDSNTKSVTPIGTNVNHRISAEDQLEYMIRFQNVDNDTAFYVVIQDQIPTALDLSTFTMRDASHPYTINFGPNHLVEWVFSPIALVDSITNEPASHGFVKFACQQVPGNPPGTRIDNEASIYFNDNLAIVTNTITNTISEEADLFLVQVDELASQGNTLIVYPNPAQSVVNFRFEQHGYAKLRFELFDLNGKRLRDVQYGRIREFTQKREGLPNGMFLFRITSKGLPIASGKIIVK